MDTDRSAARVFGLLADETRIEILRAIARAQRAAEPSGSNRVELSFSAIYEQAEIEGTSRFSYHLNELTGVFLRKGDEGYSFTLIGERIVRLILSENYVEPPRVEPLELADRCPLCSEPALEARLDDQFFYISCRRCETEVGGYPLTPAQARSRDTAAIIDTVVNRMFASTFQAVRGVCPDCGGRIAREILDVELFERDPFLLYNACESCWRTYHVPLTIAMAYHPASVAFHWDRGVDILSKPMWVLAGNIGTERWTSERTRSDPAAYEVSLRHREDCLRFVVGSGAAVEQIERVRHELGAR